MSKKLKIIVFIMVTILLIIAVLTFLYCKTITKQTNKIVEIYTDPNYVVVPDEKGDYTILNRGDLTDVKVKQISIFIE